MTNETIQTIRSRRSCRAYKPEQITNEELEAVLGAGTYAASAMGKQSAKIVVVQDAATREKLSRMNAAIMGKDCDPMYGAPTILVVLADANAKCAVQDGSLVMGNLMLAAASLGLGSCWINRAKEEFESEEGKSPAEEVGHRGRVDRRRPLHPGLPRRGPSARRAPQIGLHPQGVIPDKSRSTMKPDYKLVAKAKYIHTTADLASEIWHEVYKRYYPGKQLDTLVEELQSAEAIEADIDNDVNYFLVVLGGKNIGYFAWKMENTALHLMHLYLRPEYRGKAIGRDIVLSCERLARGEGKGRMWCTVHAKALPVQQFFKALRYRSLKPAEQETGTVPRNELVFEHTL